MITVGLVDRAIDQWETGFGRSTIKNTVSTLVLVPNEAVRDGIIARDLATDRAVAERLATLSAARNRARLVTSLSPTSPSLSTGGPRRGGWHHSWGNGVTILATTALRISEVSGLRVGDLDLVRG